MLLAVTEGWELMAGSTADFISEWASGTDQQVISDGDFLLAGCADTFHGFFSGA